MPLAMLPPSQGADKCPLWVKSGHVQRTSRCPLCANSGHCRSLFDDLVGGVQQALRHVEA